MTRKGFPSLTLTGLMLFGILFLSDVCLGEIASYCQYNPDWAFFQAGDESVQHPLFFHSGRPDEPGTRDGYEILLPRVNRPVTIYNRRDHEIPLKRGDLVTVDACGCVQTGGTGNTWKLYVAPRGDNSDRLYHGVILNPKGVPPALPGWQ